MFSGDDCVQVLNLKKDRKKRIPSFPVRPALSLGRVRTTLAHRGRSCALTRPGRGSETCARYDRMIDVSRPGKSQRLSGAHDLFWSVDVDGWQCFFGPGHK